MIYCYQTQTSGLAQDIFLRLCCNTWKNQTNLPNCPKNMPQILHSAGFEEFLSGPRLQMVSNPRGYHQRENQNQQLSTLTSRAGGEPGPDSSLARGRTAPSCLLYLHCDEFCLKTQIVWLSDNIRYSKLSKSKERASQKYNFWYRSVSSLKSRQVPWSSSPVGSISLFWRPLGSTHHQNIWSQRLGCTHTGDILKSSGRTRCMGTFVGNWRSSTLMISM